MAGSADNLVLEHLRHIRGKVDLLSDDMSDMKARMSTAEVTLGHILTSVGQINGRMDRMDQRLERIETRLDLNEAPNPAAE